MSAAAEIPGLTWKSPGAAYAWAEEEALRPDYQSPAEVIRRHGVGGYGGRSSEWGPGDFRDVAHTILATVAGLPEAYPREAFRYCHGQGVSRADTLGSTVAVHIQHDHPVDYSRVKRVATVAVRRVRQEVQGKHYSQRDPRRMGLEWYSAILHFRSKSSLYSGPWMPLIDGAEHDFRQALERGRRQARQALEGIGLVV